jgi:hypothetical protein
MSLSSEGCAVPASETVYGVEDAQNPSTCIHDNTYGVTLQKDLCLRACTA